MKYRVYYTEAYETVIEAESADEAREKFKDGHYDVSEFIQKEIADVEEAE